MSTISDDQPVNGCVPWRETEVEGENQNEKMKCKICLHNILATPNPGWGGWGGGGGGGAYVGMGCVWLSPFAG